MQTPVRKTTDARIDVPTAEYGSIASGELLAMPSRSTRRVRLYGRIVDVAGLGYPSSRGMTIKGSVSQAEPSSC